MATLSTSNTLAAQAEIGGEAIFTVTLARNNPQSSSFSRDSFQLINTGTKTIAQVNIDITNALYPDTVFDPFGLAGDTLSKALRIDTEDDTGVVAPDNNTYIGVGGTAGFEEIVICFDENDNGGFETGETLGFSIDLDPNSLAGGDPDLLNAGSSLDWNTAGVSGAELIGSMITVTFTDGSTATGQLQGNNNQAGAQALITQDSPNLDVSLTVNGLGAGGVGTYDENGPSVIVNGPAGQTARIVLTKGFIQPVTTDAFANSTDPADQAFAPVLQSQLDALAASDFPANNAVEFQTIDIVLTGGDQDISNLFNFSSVDRFDFDGEDELPLGFVASIIDPSNDDLPLGPVTQPVYLEFVAQAPPLITTAASVTVPEIQTAVLDIDATDVNGDTEGNGLTYSLTGGDDQGVFVIDVNTGVLRFITAPDFETPTDTDTDNIYEVEVTVTDSANLTAQQLISVTVSDVDETVDVAPILNAASSVIVDENQTNVLDITATDANGDSEGNGLTYSLTNGADQGRFAIDPNTGVLTFISAPDFENPEDANGDNVYDVEVTVKDTTNLTATQLLSVTVRNVSEPIGPVLRGTPQADTLVGDGADNRILGLGSDDKIQGRGGDDFIVGNAGDDCLLGNAGDDEIFGRRGNDEIDGGVGNDRLNGDRGNDTIDGGNGDDFVKGGAGRDILTGGSGDDELRGNGKRDEIDGGAGNDLIVGGFRRDTLTGGAGADTFVYRRTQDRNDIITDFEVGTDILNLRQMVAFYNLNVSTVFEENITLIQQGSSTVVNFDRDGNEPNPGIRLVQLENVFVTDIDQSSFLF
ncbi:MAG: cadherin domain-containing protein [Cyanobacteria bacterium P01_E01_bin.6]